MQSIRLCLSARDRARSIMAELPGQPWEHQPMREKAQIRCGHCNKLLAKGSARDLEIKCPRCGTLNHVRGTTPGSEPCDGQNGANNVDSKKEGL